MARAQGRPIPGPDSVESDSWGRWGGLCRERGGRAGECGQSAEPSGHVGEPGLCLPGVSGAAQVRVSRTSRVGFHVSPNPICGPDPGLHLALQRG